MADTADPVTSKEIQDAPGYESSPPLSYAYEEQQPPPYSADPEMDPPAKTEETFSSEPVGDISPEDPAPITSSAFDDKTVRRAFVRKVFAILTLQLLFTFSVVCVFTFSSVVKEAVQENLAVYITAVVIFAVVAIALTCCQSFSRRHPWNLVGLIVVTVTLSYAVGTAASFHDTAVVVITMGATLGISFAIIAYSAQTRFDFTICYGVLLVLAVDLIMFGFFCTFYYNHVVNIVYGCLGALLFSLFLMVDCQLIMRGRLDPEEYINAALVIYLDIVVIFLYLMGKR